MKLSRQLIKSTSLFSFWLILLSFKAYAQQNNQTAPQNILVHFHLTELRIRNQSPDTFFARFTLGFEQPSDAQNQITIDALEFYDVEQLTNFNQQSIETKNGKYTVGMYEGKFRAFKNYRNYPFDTHTLVIAFHLPQYFSKQYTLAPSESGLSDIDITGEAFEQWNITSIDFVVTNVASIEGFPDLSHSHEHLKQLYDEPVYAILISVSRQGSVAIFFIFGPMLILWGLAYTGLFWPNDSSPATRYGSAAILSKFNANRRAILNSFVNNTNGLPSLGGTQFGKGANTQQVSRFQLIS